MSRRALVLGATGHIGSALVRELLARDYEVTAAGRRQNPPENLTDLKIDYASGDGDSEEQLERWIAGHDVVFDAAAPYPLYLTDRLEKTQSRGSEETRRRTSALLAAVSRHRARLVYVSSFTTLRRHPGACFGGGTAVLRRLHPYFAAKEWMESQVLAAARGGVPAVIINPTACLGPWDLKARHLCLVPQLLSGELPVVADHPMNVIDVRDVARGAVAALEAQRYAEPILLCGHNTSTRSLCSWICELGGVPAPRWPAPIHVGVFAASAAEALSAAFGRRTPYPALGLLLIAESYRMYPQRGQRDLGVTPRCLSRTLVETIDWYRELGYC